MEGGAGAGVEIPADLAITAFGEAWITAANAAAGRALLGVEIGTDVQAHSAILDDLAALTQAANKGFFFDSATTAATFDLSAVGRTLIGQSTQALMRTTGLGATTVGAAVFTLANPSAITFLRINADNSVTARTAADYRSDIGLVIGTNVQAWSADLDSFVTNASWTGNDLSLSGDLEVTGALVGLGNLQIDGSASLGDTVVTSLNGFILAGTAAATYTFPGSTQTLVGLTAIQTLTNKTLTTPVITAPAIDGGQALLLTALSVLSGTPTLGLFFDSSEALTAARTITFIVSDADRTLRFSGNVGLDGEFLIDGGALTLGLTGNTNVTLPLTGTLASLTGTETFTNKTLTTPAITNPTISNTAGSTVVTFSSVASNDDPNESIVQNRVGTNNATPTVILTITIPATTTTGIKAWVVARRTGGAAGTTEDGAFYEVSVVYKNVGGTATIIGSATITAIGESQAGWDVTLNPTGGTVQILGTGAIDNNVVWGATAHLFQIGA